MHGIEFSACCKNVSKTLSAITNTYVNNVMNWSLASTRPHNKYRSNQTLLSLKFANSKNKQSHAQWNHQLWGRPRAP